MKTKIRLNDKNQFKIQISDNVVLPTESTRVLTPEGYLQATAAVTKVGVQMYSARDFGLDSDEPVGVLRPAETVFHPETIESLKMKPIVLMHPDQDVDSTNHSRLSVGSVGETVEALDSERLGASIQITDDAVVKQILGREIEELSLGYDVFIYSEEGSFNGQAYFYKMDGPMLNNHLAIVPEGRCGDSVKILDQGGSTVNRKQMIKAMKDAGISDSVIAKFMVGKKDDDPGDFKEYTKILLTGKDIDMAALIPALVTALEPQMAELVTSPEFTSMLAKEIAAGMGAAPAGDPTGESIDGDADPEAEPTEDEKKEAQEKMDAAIQDGAKKRSRLIDKAQPFIKADDSFNLFTESDRAIIEKALEAVGYKTEDMKDKSDDYLSGILDSISADRTDAKNFINKDWQKNNDAGLTAPVSAIAFKQQA